MLAHSRNRRAPASQPPSRVRTGLLETDSMVRNYSARVDIQVDSLNADWKRHIVKRWGPEGLASTITADKLNAFRDDKAFNAAWLKWRLGWETFYSEIKDTWYYVRSADKYREIEQWDLELQGWRKKFEARKVNVLMPSPSKPGWFGPTNPDVKPDGGIPWTGILIVGGLVAGASILRSLT